jgi:hypothetical protein
MIGGKGSDGINKIQLATDNNISRWPNCVPLVMATYDVFLLQVSIISGTLNGKGDMAVG